MIDLRFQPMQKRPKAQPGRPYYVKSSFAGRKMLDELERELSLLKATDIVIESGHDRLQIRNDGWPRGGSSPTHQDVRLYFKCKHGALSYECNRFDRWEHNLRAIGLWLHRQRLAIEEWGIGTGGEAYRGFAALPATVSDFSTVDDAAEFILRTAAPEASVTPSMIEAVVKDPTARFRDAARKAHPDAGGSDALMARLNRAREMIEKKGAA